MVKVNVVTTDRFSHTPQGTVAREASIWNNSMYSPLDIEGEFSAMIRYDEVEQSRSSTIFWFQIFDFTPVHPDDIDRYNEFPVALTWVPVRLTEFTKILDHRNISYGEVSGTFRFNKKGPSISLELVG